MTEAELQPAQAAAANAAPGAVHAIVLAPARRAAMLATALAKSPVVGPAAVYAALEDHEALTRALVAGRWDVVLVDARGDGPPPKAVLSTVAAHDPTLPVIVTGVQGKREAARLRAAGARSALAGASLQRLGAVVAREVRATRIVREWAEVIAAEERLALELRRRGRAVATARQAERRRLGRELHDEMGQVLTAIRLEAATLARHPEDGLSAARVAATIGQSAGTLLRMLRGRLDDLVPSPLSQSGLKAALRRRVAAWKREAGLPCALSVRGNLDDLNALTRLTAYRVVQEALTNVVRHARCSRVRVEVECLPGTRSRPDHLEVRVSDDGIGFAGGVEGRGLAGLRERLAALDGELTVTGGPGQGTRVVARLPLAPLGPNAPETPAGG